MDRREFITTCACCTFASVGAVYLDKNFNITSDVSDDFVVKSVEIHITEHCNLDCKYCFHFSNIAQKEFYNLDKFKQDVKRMSHVFNKKLLHFNIMGGEPLLNPQINKYVKFSRIYFPKTLITINTNATLLDDMDENFWKTLNEYNIVLSPSIYPIKINWKSILDKAKKYNVKILGSIKNNKELTLDNIDRYRKNKFHKIILNKEPKENIDNYKCKARSEYSFMWDGKLYPCCLIPNIRHFNKKFNKNYLVLQDDYLDLYKAKDMNDVNRFLCNDHLYPFCKNCFLNDETRKWECSKQHSIDEWT